jgi:hypothetical protein
MGAYIGSGEQFTSHADVTFDHVLPSGQKLQFSATEEVALKRPGALYVEWNGDLGARQFWYDGKSISLYDPATPFHASRDAPPDMDGMLARKMVRRSDERQVWGWQQGRVSADQARAAEARFPGLKCVEH